MGKIPKAQGFSQPWHPITFDTDLAGTTALRSHFESTVRDSSQTGVSQPAWVNSLWDPRESVTVLFIGFCGRDGEEHTGPLGGGEVRHVADFGMCSWCFCAAPRLISTDDDSNRWSAERRAANCSAVLVVRQAQFFFSHPFNQYFLEIGWRLRSGQARVRKHRKGRMNGDCN